MSIAKENRVLIVINHISAGDQDYLYRFLEDGARASVQAILGDDYQKIVKLYGRNATPEKLVRAIRAQGVRASVKRIDLFVMLHGSRRKLSFYDSEMFSRDLGAQIAALRSPRQNIKSKLRLVYNTSCYGDSHSQDFIDAGFDSAIGSKKVNGNGAVEFAPLIGFWQFNNELSFCLEMTVPLTPPSDAATMAYANMINAQWKNDIDSTKILRGNRNIKISS